MRRPYLSFTLAAALQTGVACAQLYAVPLTEPDIAYHLEGFSVLAPQGKDWFELKRDARNVFFGKKIASRTHALIATAGSAPVAGRFERPEQFLDYVGRASAEPDDNRNKLIEHRAELDPSVGPFCVRLYTKVLDRGAVSGLRHPLVMETFGVSCLHPADRGRAVNVSYSERALLTEDSEALRAEGAAFVRSLKFTDLQP